MGDPADALYRDAACLRRARLPDADTARGLAHRLLRLAPVIATISVPDAETACSVAARMAGLGRGLEAHERVQLAAWLERLAGRLALREPQVGEEAVWLIRQAEAVRTARREVAA